MSTYYLFDMHVPNIADARIVDTVLTTSDGAEFRVDGLTPVRVPDGVHVENPANLADLLQQKYAGILAQYPGFANIIYDDLLDADDVVSHVGNTKLGMRSSIAGQFRTTDVDVSGVTAAITQCILIYEHFSWRYVIPRDGRIERYYVEEPEASHQALVSVDGGVAQNTTTSGSLVVVDPTDQGALVRVVLIINEVSSLDVATERRVVNTGSWALIY
jgi:hypothetical protein